MVTYCLGSARQKREYFKKLKDCVILDNAEVLFCASENGRNYFAIGEVPFAAFTAEEYIKYRRALCAGASSVELLDKFEIPRRKRLGSLSPAQMRCVAFVEKTGYCATDKPVVINLDGAKYGRRAARALALLISACKDVYVCVTDTRYLRRAPENYETMYFGKTCKSTRPRFYAARRLAQKLNAVRVSVM